MNQNLQRDTRDQMVEAIFALDLDPIKLKLMDKNEGHGWTRAQADRCELEYKRFLVLLAKFPEEVIAPNTDVDKFWHGHILDTLKYAEDCQRVFGYFLHHFPYFGMRGDEDAANLADAAVTTRRLYEQQFGDVYGADAGYCGAPAANASYCGAPAGYGSGPAEVSTAYCGAPAAKGAGQVEVSTAYCGAPAAKGPGKAEQATAYCGAPAAKGAGKAEQATAYCGAPAAKGAGKRARATAYCGAPAAKGAGKRAQATACYDILLSKGRPKLDQLAVAGA